MKQFFFLFISLTSLILSAQQNVSSSFQFQDSIRTYTIYVPQAYLDNPSTDVPLLLNLHGYGSINWQQEFYGDFRPIADAENFIICHPNGTVDPTGSRYWNVGFAVSPIDDVGFLSALIDTINTKFNIDAEKVFSTGMSNGGFMSHKLACELPNKIKAVASVTGSMTPSQFNNCPNMNAIPVMQIHGTADPTVPYNGNTTMIPVEEVVGFWVNHNNCDSLAIETVVSNSNTSDNSTAIRYDFNSNCDDNTSVVFYKVENGGHTWPGAFFSIPGAVTNQDFNASAVIWKFFCPESKFTNITDAPQDIEVSVYPNPSSEKLQIEIADNENLVQVQIYNETGKLVSEKTEKNFNISELTKGMYFLKIKTDIAIYSRRFVKF